MTSGRGGIPAPFTGFEAAVRSEWIDENGHMNLAYYVVLFDGATDLLWDAIGLGEGYRQRTRHGTFAVETHTLYRAELLLGDRAEVATQLLGVDDKRLHLAHEMRRTDTGLLVAQQEIMLLHVSLETRRVVPFLPEIAQAAREAAQAHAGLPVPDWIGRRIAMPGAAGA